MIYTNRAWWARRSTWLWGAGTVVVAAVLGVLLSAALIAYGDQPDPASAARPADGTAGTAGLGGAEPNPDAASTSPDDGSDGSGSDGGGSDGGSGSGGGSDGGGSGVGGSGVDGSSDGDGHPGGQEPTSPGDGVAPAAEDCVSYDPTNLSVEAYGDAWRMRSGAHLMKLFDTKADAEDGVKVARNWTRMCFIGRGNDRPDRHRYIITYWQGPSGLPFGPAPNLDCVPYDPAGLAVHGPDGEGWGIRAGEVPLLVLDTAADAARAKIVAGQHRQFCLIGHGNNRPDPARYLMQHWRQ